MSTYIEDRDPGDEDPNQFVLMDLQRCRYDARYAMERYGHIKEVNGPLADYLRWKPRQHGLEKTQRLWYEHLLRRMLFPKIITDPNRLLRCASLHERIIDIPITGLKREEGDSA